MSVSETAETAETGDVTSLERANFFIAASKAYNNEAEKSPILNYIITVV